MNPRIPADYAETGRWLAGFAASHAKRESPRLEVLVAAEGNREGRSYGLRLELGGLLAPRADHPPIELGYDEIATGRSRFLWCAELAERVRKVARALVDRAPSGGNLPA